MVGVVITVLALLIIIGGIKTISKVSSVVVPVMAIFYVAAGIIVILGNIHNLPAGISMIFKMAFSVKAVGGALCGNIVASMMNAARYGVARGCFSNEAGMGSAAITAAAATTDNPVRQAYINMTGTFWDTIVVCTITGLAIASSGVLGQIDPATGQLYVGSALTIAAFSKMCIRDSFVGPPELDSEWDDKGIEGVNRFLKRFWKLALDNKDNDVKATPELIKVRHKLVHDITNRLNSFSLNTVISGFMEYNNKLMELSKKGGVDKETLETYIILLAPFAPHRCV